MDDPQTTYIVKLKNKKLMGIFLLGLIKNLAIYSKKLEKLV
jgi:hypothetical protein